MEKPIRTAKITLLIPLTHKNDLVANTPRSGKYGVTTTVKLLSDDSFTRVRDTTYKRYEYELVCTSLDRETIKRHTYNFIRRTIRGIKPTINIIELTSNKSKMVYEFKNNQFVELKIQGV